MAKLLRPLVDIIVQFIGQTCLIKLLKENQDKIDWDYLSRNPAAIHLLEKNPDKIDWDYLSRKSRGYSSPRKESR